MLIFIQVGTQHICPLFLTSILPMRILSPETSLESYSICYEVFSGIDSSANRAVQMATLKSASLTNLENSFLSQL